MLLTGAASERQISLKTDCDWISEDAAVIKHSESGLITLC